ncbi:MAG: hydroxypyruvate isomerase family protein [Pseudomonadales bacterium]
MRTFTVNLSTLFTEVPLIERFALAADHGFTQVEIQFPYELDKTAIKQQLEQYKLSLRLINLPRTDDGQLGTACNPQTREEFARALTLAAEYANFLGVKKINCLSGLQPKHLSHSAATSTLIDNLRFAANYLAPFGITLLIEAINTQDIPGFFLNNSALAQRIIETANCDNLKFQYDVYHMQIMEGNLTQRIEQMLPLIGHIQIADVPGRGEPGSGEINYPNLLNAIKLMGYTGDISLEYFPRHSTKSGLAQLEPLLRSKGDKT